MEQQLNSSTGFWANDDRRDEDDFKQLIQTDKSPLLAVGVVLFDGEKVVIQSANYIEHGWYIEIIHTEVTLWEIPYGGGEPIRVSGFLTVSGAIDAANKLT